MSVFGGGGGGGGGMASPAPTCVKVLWESELIVIMETRGRQLARVAVASVQLQTASVIPIMLPVLAHY